MHPPPSHPINLLIFLLGCHSPTSPIPTNSNLLCFSTSLPCVISAKPPSTDFYTYTDVNRLVKAFACGLGQIGIRSGDVVLVISPEKIQAPIIYGGAIAAGAIRLPDFTVKQQVFHLKYTQPKLSKFSMQSQSSTSV